MTPPLPPAVEGGKHVLVICAKRYNGHELWVALGILQQRGHTFEVVSQAKTIRDELTLRPNTIRRTVWEVPFSDFATFDGVMIVSGNMSDTEAYWDDKYVLALVREANALQKPIAAICCSVPTVREVAKGRRVSFYPLVRSRQRLSDAGALLQTLSLSRDENLVTAEHQMASQIWAEEFCSLLEGKPQQFLLHDSKYTPQGRERKPIKGLEKIRRVQENRRREGTDD